MAVGFRKVPPSEMVGNSRAVPPTCQTPRFTALASSRKWRWHGLSSLQGLQMPITGLFRAPPGSPPPPPRARPGPPPEEAELYPPSRRGARPAFGRPLGIARPHFRLVRGGAGGGGGGRPVGGTGPG